MVDGFVWGLVMVAFVAALVVRGAVVWRGVQQLTLQIRAFFRR